MEYTLHPLAKEKLAALGEAGGAWHSALPGLVRDLEQKWDIVVGEVFDGGTTAIVARARTSDGRDAVLKLGFPDPAFARQMEAIEAAKGRGYVTLLAKDSGRDAMLQEALGPSLDQLGLSPERMIETLCDTLRSAWAVTGLGLTVAPAEEKADTLGLSVASLWESLGRPCSERVLTQALTFAERRSAAFDLERCVAVHGDPHPANALRVIEQRPGAEAGFVFIDPDGFPADRAYDLGVVLRDWTDEITAGGGAELARRYCRLLASCSGVDEAAIWEWGFLERVSTGLYVLQLGGEELARRFLDTAEMLA
jgi:streptomycin 6-kinase